VKNERTAEPIWTSRMSLSGAREAWVDEVSREASSAVDLILRRLIRRREEKVKAEAKIGDLRVECDIKGEVEGNIKGEPEDVIKGDVEL